MGKKTKIKNYYQPPLPFSDNLISDNLKKTREKKPKIPSSKTTKLKNIPFGKYKGEFLEVILFKNPYYLLRVERWIRENKIENFYFVLGKIKKIFKLVDKITVKVNCEICRKNQAELFFRKWEKDDFYLGWCCYSCREIVKSRNVSVEVFPLVFSSFLCFEKKYYSYFLKNWKKAVEIKKLTKKKIEKIFYG